MRHLIILVTLTLTSTSIQAQQDRISFDYKKGEILDILLVIRASDNEDLYNRYRQTALPVAAEYSFELMSVLSSNELLLGTLSPKTFILGKWDNITKRETFLEDIVDHVPDFHQQRREIFTYFSLTYYEMPMDLTITIDESKYNVATALWSEEEESYAGFMEKWNKDITEAGGKVIVKLEGGTSPTGYYYNPDTFYIIEWDSETQFQAFAQENPMSEYEELKNIHQFSIE